MVFNPIGWITGGIIEGAGKVATDVGKTFFGDKSEKEKHISDEQIAVLNQYSAEFIARAQRTWWDSFVDGVNRLVRPGLALGAQVAFVWVYVDPVGFAECMKALQLVPEMLWYIWITIFGFFFGGRIIENAPKAWKVEPRALEVAKEIAASRTERIRAEAEEKAAIAAQAAAKAAEVAAQTAAIAADKDIEVAEKRIEVEKERQATAAIREAGGIDAPEPEVQTPDDRAPTMRISERGLNMIRRFEGFEERSYTCPGGARTIGYGHVIKQGEPYGEDGYVMDHDLAMELLDKDCDIAENAINQLVRVPLTQNQYDALVSFAYNVGVGAFAKSTMLSAINSGDMARAAAEFPRWNKSKGKVLAGLSKRRDAEMRLFLQPEENG